MGTLSNWTGFNWQADVLSKKQGRSILNLIRSLQDKLDSLDVQGMMDTLATHVADFDNPHKICIDDLPQALVTTVYNHYTTLTTTPITLDEWNTLMWGNPTLFFEICRRFQMNADSYQDEVGPVNPPVLDPTDLHTTYPTCWPLYYMSYTLPDFIYTLSENNGTYTKTLSEITTPVSTFLASIVIDPNDPATECAISLSNSNEDVLQIFFDQSSSSCYVTLTSKTLNVSSTPPVSDPVAFGVQNYYPLSVSVSDYKIAVSLTPTQMVVTYVYGGVLRTLTFGLTATGSTPVFNTLTSFLPIWKQTVSKSGIESIHIYPTILSTAEIDAVFAIM